MDELARLGIGGVLNFTTLLRSCKSNLVKNEEAIIGCHREKNSDTVKKFLDDIAEFIFKI